MNKKLFMPILLLAGVSAGLHAMEEEKTVEGLEDIQGSGKVNFGDSFKRQYPELMNVIPDKHLDTFFALMEKKNPGLVADKMANTRGVGDDVVATVEGMKAKADAALATAGVLADMLNNATGVDLKTVGKEAGEEIKGLVKLGVNELLEELKDARKTGCYGVCKSKKNELEKAVAKK